MMLGFRVWDSMKKTMHHGEPNNLSFILFPDGDFQIYDFDNSTTYDEKKRFVPMQSTGLKDCDGNLLFEGDIINVHHNDISEFREVKNVLSFHLEYAQFYYVFGEFKMYLIGNVYESPELLEKI